MASTGGNVGQIELSFTVADHGVNVLNDLQVEVFFGFEVIHHHPFCGARPFGNLFHTCAIQTIFRKQGDGADKDFIFQIGLVKTWGKLLPWYATSTPY